MQTASVDLQTFTELNAEILSLLVNLEQAIFEKPLQAADFSKELRSKRNLRIVIASIDNVPCGYLVAFEFYLSNVFFNWSTGVASSFRKRGVGTKLLNELDKVARELGYSCLRTHTKNKYRDMLVLNIKSGWQVSGTYKLLQESQLGIILEKNV